METKVGFYSDGLRIAGILYEPEAAQDRSCPGIVLCQGMVGIKEYWWLPYLGRKLADLGCVALIWDYRGIGESEGEHGRLYPLEQAEDIRNALTYLELHPKVDPGKLALAGWSFGGGDGPIRGRCGRPGRVRRECGGLEQLGAVDAQRLAPLGIPAFPGPHRTG